MGARRLVPTTAAWPSAFVLAGSLLAQEGGVVSGQAHAQAVPSESARPQPTGQSAHTPALEALAEGSTLLGQGQLDRARAAFERARDLSREGGHREIEGRARRGVGLVLLRQARNDDGRAELERALEIFEEVGSPRAANVHDDIASAEYHLGNRAAARRHYLEGLRGFEAAGNLADQAMAHHNLTFVAEDQDEKIRLIQRGLALAKQAPAPWVEANLLHRWSDDLFLRGELAASMEKLRVAIGLHEAAMPGSRSRLALTLTSLGRLHRAHGHHDRALEAYRRALELHEQAGDRRGTIQSLNAIAVAHGYLGQRREERLAFERALELARATGAPPVIRFQLANLASSLIRNGEAARGVSILEEVVREDPNDSVAQSLIAHGHLTLGAYRPAVEASTRSVERARDRGELDRLPMTLSIRARAHQKLGQTADALADLRAAIDVIEHVRAKLVPTDFMKRGFADHHQQLFALTIDLLQELDRQREALEVAEQARARAFADLLATRRDTTSIPAGPNIAEGRAATVVERQAPAEPSPSGLPLATRGGGADVPPDRRGLKPADVDLRSDATAAPLTASELSSAAKRLGSTIISYWVGADTTHIWVVRGDGQVNAVRVPAGRRRLIALARQAWRLSDARAQRGQAVPSSEDSQGETDAHDDTGLAETVATPLAPSESAAVARAWQPRVRGAGLLSLDPGARAAARTLHSLLIAPVEHLLPPTAGSLLTIVPHGPLFGVSFAALLDKNDRYLVERYATHYAPAGVVLNLTEGRRPAGPEASSYLLMADPHTLPTLTDGSPLPRLPGTRREVAQVGSLLGRGRVVTLTGDRATEAEVRRRAGGHSVLHFATHGVVRSADPLESFLALDAGRRAPVADVARTESRAPSATTLAPHQAPDDGRLTAREIYGLHLQADLVVLSACRTGLGRVSGDGVAGLARAFLYAGTRSVLATLWDVADEPSALLLPQFYRASQRVANRSQALRNAQLALLRDLRAGRVTVHTASGALALPEHPALWASFVLIGQP